MTSTKMVADISRTSRIGRRLPSLGALLDSTLDEALRARRRRVMMANNPATSLNALRVCDDALDSLVQAVGLYGQEAATLLDARVAKSSGDAKDAAVFLRIAVAVHTKEAGLAEVLARFVESHTRSVREACWFYPVPAGPFDDRAAYLPDLFEASAGSVPLMRLAIELAGLRDERRLRGAVQALVDDHRYEASAHMALARMGLASAATRHYAVQCIASGQPEHVALAMDMIGCDPRIADDKLLQAALDCDADSADAAWAVATSRDVRVARELALARSDLTPGLRARIAALGGYPADIIAACAEMAAVDGPVTRSQADLLELTLGGVPVEARCEQNDRASKSHALRKLVLRAFRQAHVGVCNDADIAPWDANLILSNPPQAAKVRLREGVALLSGVPAFGRALPEVSAALRRWLYIERAACAGHPFALSPCDVARRQVTALMVADIADSMRTP